MKIGCSCCLGADGNGSYACLRKRLNILLSQEIQGHYNDLYPVRSEQQWNPESECLPHPCPSHANDVIFSL